MAEAFFSLMVPTLKGMGLKLVAFAPKISAQNCAALKTSALCACVRL